MKKLLRVFADLRFAISLLLIISIIITIGSIIEQDQSIEFYKENYPINKSIFGFINWQFIQFFQLDHIYKTFWFISVLIIFGTSLISCTFLQQFPTLNFSRRCHFYKKLKKMDLQLNLEKENTENFIYKLINQGYFVFQQKNKFYASKGLIGRVAPVFVHLSIILILFGSVVASVCGFNAQELITKAEVFHIQNTVGSGSWSKYSQQAIRVNDFWINYYSNEKVKQFYSNISVLDQNGKELINKTISVNKPLVYKDLTFYQTDWTLVGLRFSNNDKTFQLPLIPSSNAGNKVWLTWLPTETNNTNIMGQTVIINSYKGTIYIYDMEGLLIKSIDINDSVLEKNYKLIDFLSSTGLEIKSDPGVLYIYIGFGFLMISTLLSYISFSQVWTISNKLSEEKNLTIFAKTNRNKVSLNVEIFKIIN